MRKYLLSLCFLFSVFGLKAQYFEAGLSGGISNYLGDLTPSGFWASFGDPKPSSGALVRYYLNDWLSFRGAVNYGEISANDARATRENGRRKRNLSFRSDIYEIALMAEINLLGYDPRNRHRPVAPYLFAGIAYFQFNPQASFEDTWYDLQPLGTEGQGLEGYGPKYDLAQFSIPAGIGIKLAISKRWNIGGEFGMRKTFTDYLDDVSGVYPDLNVLAENYGTIAAELSWRGDEFNPEALPPQPGAQRGDPLDLDWYIFTGFFISYNFLDFDNSNKRKTVNAIRCPKF